jgi:hypothetical protein
MAGWFEVDRKGLAKLLQDRGVAFVLYELLANAWDAPGTSLVRVILEPIAGGPRARLTIMDDAPGGFTLLEHAWTLFAESERKTNAEARGRWNLGEKLVLSMCESAEVITTTGGVRFDKDGRHMLRRKRTSGSSFAATIRLPKKQVEEVLEAAKLVIPPPSVTVMINGGSLPRPVPVRAIPNCTLATEIADGEYGVLRKSRRATTVRLYQPTGQGARLCEMGIPVVATDLPWTVDVAQKIPLTLDRGNVAPGFLRELRVIVLNHMAEKLPEAAINEPWVRQACSGEDAAPAAVRTVLTRRYGADAVAYDPTDLEGTKLSVAAGTTVVYPASLSAGEWKNARKADLLPPAGTVTPSPRVLCSENGIPPEDPETWKPEWTRRAAEIVRLSQVLFGFKVVVQIQKQCLSVNARAWYGMGGVLTLHVWKLGNEWFKRPLADEDVLSLIIHELAHEYAKDHLSNEYHRACCDLGARLAMAVAKNPDLLKDEVLS